MAKLNRSTKSGLSLIEVILAVALFGLFATAVIGLLVNSYGSNLQAEEKDKATLYAQEGIDAVWSVRRLAWNLLVNGNHGLTKTNNHWEFFGLADSLDDKYTRVITITDGCRDISGNAVDCDQPGSALDLHIKKATVKVTYTTVTGVNNEVELAAYLTTWQSKDWLQTDWSGGLGQNTWSNPARYSSDDGNIDVSTVTGAVTLKSFGSGGCGVKSWPFSNPADYTYNSNEIEVSGGVAQLKSITACTGTPVACSTLSDQTTCQAQAGCTWSSASCRNVGSCSAQPRNQCNSCSAAGCSRVGNSCSGVLTCSIYTNQLSCQACGQCSWVGTPTCSGTPTNCSAFSNQTACFNQDGCSWSSAFPTSANISPVTSYSVSTIDGWTAFSETATKNGGEIYYQLSDNDGASWYYWNGSAWAIAGAGNYNTASIINTNISKFSIANKKISFRAFLVGNGSQQVQLDEVKISCAQYYDWPFSAPADYIYDPNKIEVTSGVAQLKGQSTGSSGGTINADFNTGLTPWAFGSWGTAASTGSWSSTGGNPGGYAKIQFPSTKNNTSGGYFEQSFTVTEPTIALATVNLNWTVTQYTRNAQSLNLYAFVDTVSGAPTIGTQVWSSGNRTGLSGWATVSNINVASKITGPGTYYLKVAAYVNYPKSGANASYAVGFDNVLLNWSSGNISYPADGPAINPAASLAVANLDTWSSFAETASKAGGEIYYQLSDDDGASWYYWNGSKWVSAGAGNYNVVSDINTNIFNFSTSTGKIMFKAFLFGNGSQQVKLDNIKVGWGQPAASGYATFGSLVSSAFNTGSQSSFNIMSWSENVADCAPSCAIKLQLRTAPDAGGSPGSWTVWYGSSGPDSYFSSPAETLLSTDFNYNQWVQYRAELSGDGITTPVLEEVKVNYTP